MRCCHETPKEFYMRKSQKYDRTQIEKEAINIASTSRECKRDYKAIHFVK